MTDLPEKPEFSRQIDVGLFAANDGLLGQNLTATPEECGKLARRLGVMAISSLHLSTKVQERAETQSWVIIARAQVSLTQACAATLQPVTHTLDVPFVLVLGGEPLDHDEDWEPLPFDGLLDIGEVATHYISLAIDPYMRHPDAVQSSGAPDATSAQDLALCHAQHSPESPRNGSETLPSKTTHTPFAGLAEKIKDRTS